MFNLLPQKEKTKISKQYRMRKMVVALSFLLVILIISAVFLLPSYVFTMLRENEVNLELETIKTSLDSKNNPELEKSLSEINKVIEKTKIEEDRIFFYDTISRLIKNKPRGVHIKSLNLQDVVRGDSGNKSILIQLAGTSDTRKALVDYRDELEADDLFSDVDLPVSSLAKQFNADFVFNIVFDKDN